MNLDQHYSSDSLLRSGGEPVIAGLPYGLTVWQLPSVSGWWFCSAGRPEFFVRKGEGGELRISEAIRYARAWGEAKSLGLPCRRFLVGSEAAIAHAA